MLKTFARGRGRQCRRRKNFCSEWTTCIEATWGLCCTRTNMEYSSGSFIYRDPPRLIALRATLRPDVRRVCGQRLQLAMFSALTLWRSGRRRAARIVPILHALLEESIARLALQSLLVRTELAGRHFPLCIDCKTRPRRQEHNQSGSKKRATRHDESPGSPRLEQTIRSPSFILKDQQR